MLTTLTQARALVRDSVRAPKPWRVGVAAFALVTGLAMGGAFLGGSVAKSMSVKADAVRLAGAAQARFSNPSVIEASGVDSGEDAGALAIARRHDPYLVAGDAQRDREATLFAARMITSAPAAQPSALSSLFGLRKASFTTTVAARPFRMPGALDASRDLDCLTQAVYFEARGEGQAGMAAVAQVVLNRVRHPAFPKTVCSVVFQGAAEGGCQFSFACDGSMRKALEPYAWQHAREIAARALSGHVMAEVGNATHFHTVEVSPGWRVNMLRIAQIGSHVFYRFGGSAGAPDAFRFHPRPSTGAIETVKPIQAGFVPVKAAEAVAEPVKALVQDLTDAARGTPSPKPAPAPAPTKPVEPSAKGEVAGPIEPVAKVTT